MVIAAFDDDIAQVLASSLGLLAQASPSDDRLFFVDALDGYLTALRCGPVEAQPLQAMDALFGEHWPAVLDDQDATEVFAEALQARWEEIGAALEPNALQDDPEAMQLMPLLTDFDAQMQADLAATGVLGAERFDLPPSNGALWCEGFLRAVSDHDSDWHRFPQGSVELAELHAMLQAIAAVTWPGGARRDAYIAAAYEPHDKVDQNMLLDDALFTAQDLRVFWQQQAERPLAS